jgi:hypothetical protein
MLITFEAYSTLCLWRIQKKMRGIYAQQYFDKINHKYTYKVLGTIVLIWQCVWHTHSPKETLFHFQLPQCVRMFDENGTFLTRMSGRSLRELYIKTYIPFERHSLNIDRNVCRLYECRRICGGWGIFILIQIKILLGSYTFFSLDYQLLYRLVQWRSPMDGGGDSCWDFPLSLLLFPIPVPLAMSTSRTRLSGTEATERSPMDSGDGCAREILLKYCLLLKFPPRTLWSVSIISKCLSLSKAISANIQVNRMARRLEGNIHCRMLEGEW